MTTLVVTQTAREHLSMSNNRQRRTSKRLAAAAEFERDDDFQFVRKSKRTKPVKQWEPSPTPRRSTTSEQIALPMSDTPIINRNKEWRKKGGKSNRRSSLGSRGRRASSLIDHGQTATPHEHVDSTEFYKHIAAEGLPEPRRMKQLLMWCGERALPAKPPLGTPDSGAILGARAIQDQILKGFAQRSEFSDWFSRNDDAAEEVILKPNPQNIELDQRVSKLEANIKRLEEEKHSWLAIQRPPTDIQPPPLEPESLSQLDLPQIDLLEPEEGNIRTYLAEELVPYSTLRKQTEDRIRTIQASLEFEVDQLSNNVHKLQQRVEGAGRQADAALKLSARGLKDREQREKTSAGTRNLPVMEVLRGLSGILPES